MSHTLFTSIPPPSHTLSVRPLSPASALQHLETYLHATTLPSNAHLHPDVHFNERGPTLEGRAPGGGLILHQLDRVAKGLRGIRLVPQENESFQEGGAEVIMQGLEEGEVVVGVGGTQEPRIQDESAGDGEVNGDYGEQMRGQGEEGIEEGELGERSDIVADGEEIEMPAIEPTNGVARKERREKKRRRRAEDESEEPRPSKKKRKRHAEHDESEEPRSETKKRRKHGKDDDAQDAEVRERKTKRKGSSPGVDSHDAETSKRKQRREEKRRRKEQESQRIHDEAANALAAEADDLPNGHSQVNGVASGDFSLHGDVHRAEKMERKARKAEKRARKEARRLAEAQSRSKDGVHGDVSSPVTRSGEVEGNAVNGVLDGSVRESLSPGVVRHRANEKKKRRRRGSSE